LDSASFLLDYQRIALKREGNQEKRGRPRRKGQPPQTTYKLGYNEGVRPFLGKPLFLKIVL
jgi:hypothetical protein